MAAKPIRIGTAAATAAGGGRPRATRGRTVVTALNNLSRKVLFESETPESSLTARLLQAHKPKNADGTKKQTRLSENQTIYTVRLEEACRAIIEEHHNDPNKAQTDLINFMFRSVGGTPDTFLDPELVRIEDMDSEEWGNVITDLVDDMSYTPADCVLLCADPNGAVHAAAVESGKPNPPLTNASLGVREYRKIYQEFWSVLCTVALTEGFAKKKNVTTSFDAELAKDLIHRVNELATVGQPDIRAAATIASMKMAEAILHRTVELSEKLDKANRQFKASGGSKGGTKAEAAKAQVDSLKRVVSDLEEIVLGNVIPAVFMHRYRDSNMYIRAFSLDSLSAMTMLRPDLFLADKFTKYFGWMLSDKEACVRIASINGIMKPFQAVGTDPKNTAQARMVKQIDLDKMENVVGKFRVRLADCCIDVNTAVQEKAMACLLLLERNSFMDDLEDERVWDQINRRAISLDTTPSVRRDALYFVLEQLEAFDDDDFEEMAKQTDGLLSLTNTTTTDTPKGKKRTKTTTKGASLVQSVEKMTIQRLDALAAWLAHTLTDGPIKLEDIRIDLADCLVESLRSMPEHKILVTRWPAMLKTIGDDTRSGASGNRKKGTQNRVDVARQRVLVQMLASAVQAEVGDVASDDFLSDTDGAFVNPQTSGGASSGPSKRTKRRKTGVAAGLQHEVLSAALLKALPDLLLRFKTDPAILSSVAILARYLRECNYQLIDSIVAAHFVVSTCL